MISIGTDLGGLILQNTLQSNTIGLNHSIERMTTGYKINHAKDDAAGFAVAEGLSTKISSMIMVQQNVDEGIALLKTAEGALDNILDLLQRLRDLAEQAGNEVYGEDSRKALQAEADEIIKQIEQIKATTEFNGLNLFEAPAEKTSKNLTSRGLSNSSVHIECDSNTVKESDSIESENNKSFTEILDSVDEEVKELSSSLSSSLSSESSNAVPFSGDISGAEDFNGNETRIITIDGVQYTVKNRTGTKQTLSYTKDSTTGELMLIGNDFEIRGQSDVQHNLIINGKSNYVYGGDLDDSISTYSSKSANCSFYGGKGNDVLYSNGGYTNLFGGDGSDILNININTGSFYGGADDDTININSGGTSGATVYGEDGNDVFNIKAGSWRAYGGNGNDSFNVSSGISDVFINGNEGTNTVDDKGTNTIKVNVVGANAEIIDFNANQTKSVSINGINYNITNNNSSATSLVYTIESNKIKFLDGRNFTIKGDLNKVHTVEFAQRSRNNKFYGGNLNDTIISYGEFNYIFGLRGDDSITAASGRFQYLYGGDGNDTINSSSTGNMIYSESGNDSISISGNYSMLDAGAGDDSINVSSSYSGIYGGSGTNTITDIGTETLINGFGAKDNAQVLLLGASSTKSVNIDSKTYQINNKLASDNIVLYSYNSVSGVTTFYGSQVRVKGESDVAHNVFLSGWASSFEGGNLNDNIKLGGDSSTAYGYGGDDTINLIGNWSYGYGGDGNDVLTATGTSMYLYGEKGDDTLNINNATSNTINGGQGNDTYNINAACSPTDDGGNNIYNINTDGANITGSSGNDTFYVKGKNNTISGAGGDDYFVIDAVGDNLVDGGTGDNFYVDNSEGTADVINVTNDPNSGILNFTYVGEEKDLIIDGKKYVITNTTSQGSPQATNSLKYSYNPQTGEVTVTGSNFTITSDSSANLLVRGDNNVLNGSSGNDKITIESGTNNLLNGNDGNDSLIMNSANNSILGGLGNDTITLNASSDKTIDSGVGNDLLNINSDNNTNIQTGDGDDRVNGTGNSNIINLGMGNNNVLLNGNSNKITGLDGDNRISAVGDNNTILSGNGNNVLGVDGANNIITGGNGNNSYNIYGSKNQVNGGSGKEKVVINGIENEYLSTLGNKTVDITGNDNVVNTGIGNDRFIINGDNNTISSTDGSNSVDILGNSNNYTGGLGVDIIKLDGDTNRAEGGGSNDSFTVKGGNHNYIDGNDGNRNTMIDRGIDTEYYNVLDVTPSPFELDLKVDIGSGKSTMIHTEISFDINDLSVDFSSDDGARKALDDIDYLIDSVQDQVLELGATINRLEGVSEAQSVKMDNLISSLSTIKDADIAEESSNFIRYQILQNATASLLSSSRNLRGETVLGILGNVSVK